MAVSLDELTAKSHAFHEYSHAVVHAPAPNYKDATHYTIHRLAQTYKPAPAYKPAPMYYKAPIHHPPTTTPAPPKPSPAYNRPSYQEPPYNAHSNYKFEWEVVDDYTKHNHGQNDRSDLRDQRMSWYATTGEHLHIANRKAEKERHEISEKHDSIRIGIIMSGILAIALVCAVLSMGYWWYKKKLARSKAAMECDTIQIPRIYGNTMVDLKQMEPRQKRYPKKQLSSSSDEDEIKDEMRELQVEPSTILSIMLIWTTRKQPT